MSDQPSRRSFLSAAALAAVAVPTVVACGRKTADVPNPGTVIAQLDAVPDGGTVVVLTVNGDPVVLTRDGESVSAYSGICPHQGCSVRKEPEYILCPCHNSKFDWDGSLISGIANAPLAPIAVTIEDGEIITVG